MPLNRARVHVAALLAGFVLTAIAWAALFTAQFGRPTLSTRWAFELLEAKDAIARAVPGRRVLIGGGSGALFGIRADQLQQALGVPVLNMASYAGLGLPYLLHRLEKQARRGDVIVLAIEYELYSREGDANEIDFFSGRDPGYFLSLPVPEQVAYVLEMHVGRAFGPWLEERRSEAPRNPLNVYEAPRHLDEVGDTLGNNAVLKNDASRDQVRRLLPLEPSLSSKKQQVLRGFSNWASTHGVRVISTHANLIDFGESWRAPRTARAVRAIDALHEQAGMPFVDAYPETLYPRANFFDTTYHLDSMGARIRTAQLAERLRPLVAHDSSWAPVATVDNADFPLAQLAHSFANWEPMQGFGPLEGPYPQWNLGAVIWALAPESRLAVRVDRDTSARLVASIRGSRPHQTTRLVVNGRSVGELNFENDRDFRDWALTVPLSAGTNDVRLLHSGASSQAALIRELRFVPRPTQ